MQWVEKIEELEALYGPASVASQRKVATRLTPLYRKWIMASRFCVLSTVGPDGTDGSPRGDDGPVVREWDEHTLLMPDWRGNNRMDSLRNIVADGRVSLMFMVPGSDVVVRVNGQAKITTDPEMCDRFDDRGRRPKSVIVIAIGEVYTQCAKALMRSGLWGRDDAGDLPTMGEILAEQTDGETGGAAYDADLAERLPRTLW